MKNQLQAELSSTLQRRKNNDVPNKKPNFVVPKNTTINAIYNQLKVLEAVEKAMSGNADLLHNNATTSDYSNSSSDESAPSGRNTASTLPRRSAKNAAAAADKPKLMISHGKPNFVRPAAIPFKVPSSSSSPAMVTNHTPVVVTAPEMVTVVKMTTPPPATTTSVRLPPKPAVAIKQPSPSSPPPPPLLPPQPPTLRRLKSFEQIIMEAGNREPSATPINSQKPQSNGAWSPPPQLMTKHTTPLSNRSTPTSGRSSPFNNHSSSSACSSPLPPRKTTIFKQLQQQYQETTTPPSTATTAAPKTPIATKSVGTVFKSKFDGDECEQTNEIQRKLQSLKTVDMHEVTRNIASNHQQHNYDAIDSSAEQHRVKWSKTTNESSKTTTTTSSISNNYNNRTAPAQPTTNNKMVNHPNFNVKPMISFSKDLSDTPNRYPDTVKVMRSAATVTTATADESAAESKENNYFSDLKFIINEYGEVVQSSITH